MADQVPVTNKAAEIVGGFVKALMSGGESAAETYIKAELPFLALPVFSQITDWIVGSIGSEIQTVIINGTTKMVINIQTGSEQSAVVAAATALQMAQQSGDQVAIAKALTVAKKAYLDLGNWDGTYSP